MSHYKLVRLAIAGLLGAILSPVGFASSFTIKPVRVELTAAKLNSVVQINNAGDDAVTIQASVLSWTTDGEKDLYSPVDDILLNPPVFTIPAHATQMLRLGLRKFSGAPGEQAYRLILAEVPKPLDPGFVGLRTVLRISIPIFIKPPTATYQLFWESKRNAEGTLVITAVNRGRAHVQIRRIDVASSQSEEVVSKILSDYLLPQQKREWTFDEPQLRGLFQIDLTAKTDAEDSDAKLAVAEH